MRSARSVCDGILIKNIASIVFSDAKLSEDIPRTYATALSDQAEEARANIPDFVVSV